MDDRDDEGDELMVYIDAGKDRGDLIMPLWKTILLLLLLLAVPFTMAGVAAWGWEAGGTHPWAFVRGAAMMASLVFSLGSIAALIFWCVILMFFLDTGEVITETEAKARKTNSRFDQRQEDWEEEEDNPPNLPRRGGMGPL